ncbi:MAG TPA: radical SAM protein [Candidatus Binataceae bacterium]|nr:radical SAM protein [Candidatus Binataceae bacterium]
MSSATDAGKTWEVVLVYPPAEVIREEVYDRPCFPAIGIAYVGGWLEKHLSTVPLIIDSKLERLTLDQTVEKIVAARPRIVGLSAFTHMVVTAHRIAQRVREQLPDVVMVLGGFHASFLPERSLEEFPAFDYLVVGEGELAFSDLVSAIRAGNRKPVIPGVWYRGEDGKAVNGGRGAVTATLDETGFAAWHLFNREAIKQNARILPIMSLRGCPFTCNFCSRPYGRAVRKRSPQHVVDEMQRNIEEFGVHTFPFHDETFTVNRKHVVDMCNEILARGLKVQFSAMVHANTIDIELVRLMKQAGCVEVGLGVESGDPDIMAAMKKGVTKERIKAAADAFHQVGLDFLSFFIIGHPGETWRTALRSIKFAAELNGKSSAFGIMVPYPGTEVWEMAIKGEGGYRKLSTNWEDYNKQLGNAVELEHLSRRQMEMLQIFGYVFVYLYHARLSDLMRAVTRHRTRVGNILKKVAFGRLSTTPPSA